MLAVPHARAATCHLSHSYPDGACLYFTFAATPPADEVESTYMALWDAGTRAVLAHGGNLSHHHGVGLNRSRYMREALGPAFDVLVAMKHALDPTGILNPGKLGLPSPFGERSSGERWDVPALRAGASVCAVFAVPLQVIAQVLGRDSGLADLLTVVSFGGFVLGGGVAAWSQRRQLALSHSLVTVLGTFLVLQLLFVLARAVSGNDVRLRPDVPALTAARARIDFTQRAFSVT
eukprot:gene31467-53779_t